MFHFFGDYLDTYPTILDKEGNELIGELYDSKLIGYTRKYDDFRIKKDKLPMVKEGNIISIPRIGAYTLAMSNEVCLNMNPVIIYYFFD